MRLDMSPLASTLIRKITDRPQQFHELVDAHREIPWPDFLRAWGELRRADILSRDEDGNYLISEAKCGVLIPTAHVGYRTRSK
jgi:hypothetical protein